LHTTIGYPPFCGKGTRWVKIRIFTGQLVLNKNSKMRELTKIRVWFKLIYVKILQYKDTLLDWVFGYYKIIGR
jgi:hypothetical protein